MKQDSRYQEKKMQARRIEKFLKREIVTQIQEIKMRILWKEWEEKD